MYDEIVDLEVVLLNTFNQIQYNNNEMGCRFRGKRISFFPT